MATIGIRNIQIFVRLRALQCTVRDSKSCDKAVHVVTRPCPSGVKVSIGISSLMQKSPPCTALLRPTEHYPHRRIVQVFFLAMADFAMAMGANLGVVLWNIRS